MGHLLTVQNILLFFRAPATLGRENSIWAEKYYPYPFSLDPLSLDSLRCFVYAGMPDPDSETFKMLSGDDRRMLKKLTKKVEDRFKHAKVKADVHRVGARRAHQDAVIEQPAGNGEAGFERHAIRPRARDFEGRAAGRSRSNGASAAQAQSPRDRRPDPRGPGD